MFKRGDRVKILSTIYTRPKYSINSEMQDMVGKIKKVENVERDGLIIRLGGFMWRPEDLAHVNEESIDPNKFRKYNNKIKFQFDPKNLDV